MHSASPVSAWPRLGPGRRPRPLRYGRQRTTGRIAMRQLIAGNWKMNGLTAQAGTITGALRDDVGSGRELGCDLLVCPPFTQIIAVAQMLAGSAVAVGGQDCHTAAQGAHTGDIAAPMLRD